MAAPADSSIRSFKVAIPQKTIDGILARVRTAQWPDPLLGSPWQYGADWAYMKELADYWTSRFDWRKAEAKLNTFPQFKAQVDDYEIHFYHVRGAGPRPAPKRLALGRSFGLKLYRKLRTTGYPGSAGGPIPGRPGPGDPERRLIESRVAG